MFFHIFSGTILKVEDCEPTGKGLAGLQIIVALCKF